ncbi:MAG TPA: NAD(P)/FAD-dependent oxidoreductase [Bradyrhizobium sp.]|nr:NAD(P)/FAD-dependent oxidoreductase [Bradyrhizobium sp.]
MGCATAWHLAARGKKVALFERAVEPRVGLYPSTRTPSGRGATFQRGESALGRDYGTIRR